MCPNQSWFLQYKKIEGGRVILGNNHHCAVVGIGSVVIKTEDGVVRILEEVTHVPDLKRNLMSLGMLDSTGHCFKAESGVLKIIKGSLVVMKGSLKNGLYVLKGQVEAGEAEVVSESKKAKATLWHRRLGHVSERGLCKLSKQGLLCGDQVTKLDFREHCIYGKSQRLKFGRGIHCTKATLDHIHLDLWRVVRTVSLGGARYFMTLVDDYSRRLWVYILKTKDDAFGTFKNWKTLIETQTGKKIRRLRTDKWT